MALPLSAAQPAAAAGPVITLVKNNYVHDENGSITIPSSTAVYSTSTSIPDLRDAVDSSWHPSSPDYNDQVVAISTSDPLQAARVGVALWSDVNYSGSCWQYFPAANPSGVVALPPGVYQDVSSVAIGQTCPRSSDNVMIAAAGSHDFLRIPNTSADLRSVRWADGTTVNDSIEALTGGPAFVNRRASVYTDINFKGACYTWNPGTSSLPAAFSKTISSIALDVDCSQDAGLTLGQRLFIGTNNESGVLSAKAENGTSTTPAGTAVSTAVGSYTSSGADLAWYVRPVKVNFSYRDFLFSSGSASPQLMYQVIGVRGGDYSRPQCLTANRPVAGSAVALQNPPGSGTGVAAQWKLGRGVTTRDCDSKATDPYQMWALVTQAPANPNTTQYDGAGVTTSNSPATSPATKRARGDSLYAADPKTRSGSALVSWGVSTESTATPSMAQQVSLTYDSYGTIGLVADQAGPIAVWRPRINADDVRVPPPAKAGTQNPKCTRGTGLSCMTAVTGS